LSGQWSLTTLDVTFSDGKRLTLDTGGSGEAPKFGDGSDVAPKFIPFPGGKAPQRDAPASPGKDSPPKEIPGTSRPGKEISGKEIRVEPPSREIELEIPK
jgi:hypothetical protein